MKRLLIVLFCLFTYAFGTIEAGNGKGKNIELPEQSTEWIKTHCQGLEVLDITKGRKRSFNVLLSDSTTVNFAKKGMWTYISNVKLGIPSSMVPSEIVKKLAEKFPDGKFRLVHLTHKKGYRAELSKDIDESQKGVQELFNYQFVSFDENYKVVDSWENSCKVFGTSAGESMSIEIPL